MLQLLLHFGGVQNHGVLDGKTAVRGQNLFVVRGTVLACIGDAARFHGLLCFGQIPSLGLGAGEGDAVQCVQMQDQVHHRGGDKIDVLHRLAQHGHVGGQAVHLGRILRHHEEFLPGIRDAHHGIAAFVAVRRELLCIVQLVMVGENKTFCIRRLRLAAAAGKRQCCSREKL